ncbi:hypothetical protein EDB89DRAFT_2069574 [Lactarius sanguifluus]|nr:hypothetical protein EDB89DRAFT_2069574 [Lactarius sanguifluus]
MPGSPSARALDTSTTNRQSLAFDSPSSFLSRYRQYHWQVKQQPRFPNSAPNSTPRVKFLRRRLPRAESVGLGLGSSARPQSGTTPSQEISIEPRSSRPQSTDFLCPPAGPAFRSPRPDGDTASPNPSKGRIHDNGSWSNNGVTNNGVYGDDGDLIRATMFLVLVVSKVALRDCALMAAVPGLVGKAPHPRTRLAVSAEATTEATRWLRRISKPHWLASGWASADSASDLALPG